LILGPTYSDIVYEVIYGYAIKKSVAVPNYVDTVAFLYVVHSVIPIVTSALGRDILKFVVVSVDMDTVEAIARSNDILDESTMKAKLVGFCNSRVAARYDAILNRGTSATYSERVKRII
jgi:hypothetical protein